jgi:DNA polymerase-3 subunit epsilon
MNFVAIDFQTAKYSRESSILAFIGESILAAHNAEFDMSVLRALFKWYGISKPVLRYFCTLTLARHTWPELESHALTALGKSFGIIYKAHNALDDARTCGDIVFMAANKYGSITIDDLVSASKMKMDIL